MVSKQWVHRVGMTTKIYPEPCGCILWSQQGSTTAMRTIPWSHPRAWHDQYSRKYFGKSHLPAFRLLHALWYCINRQKIKFVSRESKQTAGFSMIEHVL